MDKSNITREYSNGEITVVWQSARCIHSGNCVRNLVRVFNPQQSPWIKMGEGTTEEIRDTVAKCPSGAISIK